MVSQNHQIYHNSFQMSFEMNFQTSKELFDAWSYDEAFLESKYKFTFSSEEISFLRVDFLRETLAERFSVPIDFLSTDLSILEAPRYIKQLQTRRKCFTYLERRGVHLSPHIPNNELKRISICEKIREYGHTVSSDISNEDAQAKLKQLIENPFQLKLS